jgi:SAM-dependent methyltransferase
MEREVSMSLVEEVELERTRVDAFAERMLDVLNSGALALAISIGHRTGLFDVMGLMPPSSSESIAEEAGLDERYVREWLGAMVTGGIVEHFPIEQTYYLPPEHAAALTRRASPNNLAVPMQFVPVLARVEDTLVDSFRAGGGVGYEHYPRFQEVMAEMSRQTVVSALFDAVLPMVPGLTVRLQEGIDVLYVGCGLGRALIAMACEYPNSRFRGVDLSSEAIAGARARVGELCLHNITFDQMDAAMLDELSAYDLITAFDAIHDQAVPDRVLTNIRNALRPDGVFLMQDIATSTHLEANRDHPIGPFLYSVSFMHCMTVSLAQDGAGLGTCWGREQAVEMLGAAGFSRVDMRELPHDFMNYFCVVRP